uniref:Uncharacterized protein n=1 Tax=Aegilops tauschii subsp. strangulata TaxID=200361 RepID=A0A452Y996_AEGTS
MFPSTKCFLLGFRRNLLTLLYMQVDETEVIGVLLQTELIPLCRRTMEMGSELSENVVVCSLLSWLRFFLLVAAAEIEEMYSLFPSPAASSTDNNSTQQPVEVDSSNKKQRSFT